MSSSPRLRVQIATFNYNLRGDPRKATPDLRDWLIPRTSEDDTGYITGHGAVTGAQGAGREAPDIYAVGFQEHLPLHIGFSGSGQGTPWLPLARGAGQILDDTDTEIRRTIRPHAAAVSESGLYPEKGGPENYTLLARVHMAGISLFIYGRDRSGIAERVKEIRTNFVGTGIFGLLGNKGAVGARLVLGPSGNPSEKKAAEDQVLTFVCAHLAAHDHNIARRDRDYADIVSRLAFTPDKVLPLPTAPPPVGKASKPADLHQLKEQYAQQTSGPKRKPASALDDKNYTLYDSSNVFFFGDLNYRIAVNTPPKPKSVLKSNDKLTATQVVEEVHKRNWPLLSEYDQLSIERLSGRAFQGLTEVSLAQARIAPTYKYKVFESPALPPGSPPVRATPQQTRQLSSKRIPGWCDRILWRSWADGTETHASEDTGAIKVELCRSIMDYTVRCLCHPRSYRSTDRFDSAKPAFGSQARHGHSHIACHRIGPEHRNCFR